MAWNFETDTDFQEQLDWIDDFVREEIEPLDFIITSKKLAKLSLRDILLMFRICSWKK